MGDLGDFWRDVKADRPALNYRAKKAIVKRKQKKTIKIESNIQELQRLGYVVKLETPNHVGSLIVNEILRLYPYYNSYQELKRDPRDSNCGQYKDMVMFVVEFFKTKIEVKKDEE